MKFLKLFFYRPFSGVNFTQFLDTLGNNFLRNAITAAVIFGIIKVDNSAAVSSLMVGVLMLPSFLFMATAGEIADKYPKDAVIKIQKIAQFFVVLIACAGFATENIGVLLTALFLTGTGAAFLSTAKYSILPEIVPPQNLLAANGIMQMMVFVAILGGTILGGIIFSAAPYMLYLIPIAISLAGVLCAFMIPRQNAGAPDTVVQKNPIAAIWKNLSFVLKNKEVVFYSLGISWFWFVGTVIISQIPAFSKDLLQGDDTVFTLFIVLFSIGVGIGTILCQIISRGKASDKLIIPCLSVIILTLADLAYTAFNYVPYYANVSFVTFLGNSAGIRIAADVLLFSVAGGIYIVPLTTMLQILSSNNTRARIIAANNIINALFMILGSGFCALLLFAKINIPQILVMLAILNGAAIILYCIKKRRQTQTKKRLI